VLGCLGAWVLGCLGADLSSDSESGLPAYRFPLLRIEVFLAFGKAVTQIPTSLFVEDR